MNNSLKDIQLTNFPQVLSNDMISKFRERIISVFELRQLEYTSKALYLGHKNYNMQTDMRVLHYCIKTNESDMIFCEEICKEPDLIGFINDCMALAQDFNLPTRDRYIFLTLDQGLVRPGKTLRSPGWHLDGLQGDEVVQKVEADYQFIRSNTLSTEFVDQAFDVSHLDTSKHNIFKALEKQVDEKNIYQFPNESLVLMNPYDLHRATLATDEIYRLFLRLSFTKTPVTSLKMTLNPAMKYNYPIHSTTGEIPSHLI